MSPARENGLLLLISFYHPALVDFDFDVLVVESEKGSSGCVVGNKSAGDGTSVTTFVVVRCMFVDTVQVDITGLSAKDVLTVIVTDD